MAVTFEFTAHKGFEFAKAFAEKFHQPVHNNRVMLPTALGEGYIEEVYLDNDINLCMHKYRLKQSFEVRRVEGGTDQILTLKFTRSGFLSNAEAADNITGYRSTHSAEIGTANLFTKIVFPKHATVDFLVMNIPRAAVEGLLQAVNVLPSLQHTLPDNGSFAFYENMDDDMEKVLLELQAISQAEPLSQLLYKSKLYELLYRLLRKLMSRDARKIIAVNQQDAEKIYELKTILLSDLSVPPQLPELARKTGMSETKMKRLFRQVFGHGIYEYYQQARMNEASRLLSSYSVSETGYKLGFKNLSHFSRLFQKHHSKNPKHYKNNLSS